MSKKDLTNSALSNEFPTGKTDRTIVNHLLLDSALRAAGIEALPNYREFISNATDTQKLSLLKSLEMSARWWAETSLSLGLVYRDNPVLMRQIPYRKDVFTMNTIQHNSLIVKFQQTAVRIVGTENNVVAQAVREYTAAIQNKSTMSAVAEMDKRLSVLKNG
jgi:hypothetical protein